MKKIFSIALSAMLLLGAFTCLAQGKPDKKEWQEKMKAEKVAYLTDYMNLTSAEAQKFWPVYNQAESEKMEGFKNTMDAYKALETAIKRVTVRCKRPWTIIFRLSRKAARLTRNIPRNIERFFLDRKLRNFILARRNSGASRFIAGIGMETDQKGRITSS